MAVPVRGFVLDITGVLYNSGAGDGQAIAGSAEAVRTLYERSRVVFLSNESTTTREELHEKLMRLGFELRAEDILLPAPVASAYVQREKLRPLLLTHPSIRHYFTDHDEHSANCVLMGDAEEEFTYANLNRAFRVLLRHPLLITLGVGRFYQRVEGPCLDVGSFAQALEFATSCHRVAFGKPSQEGFDAAVAALGVPKAATLMIGDDILSDVGGAQKAGLRAAQVRTGKWRPEWEQHPTVHPDFIFDDLASAVHTFLP